MLRRERVASLDDFLDVRAGLRNELTAVQERIADIERQFKDGTLDPKTVSSHILISTLRRRRNHLMLKLYPVTRRPGA